MICHKCHRNIATIRYAEVMDGNVVEQRICAACAARLNAEGGFEIASPTLSGRRTIAERAVRNAISDKESCPNCGAAYSIMDVERMGCPVCYRLNHADVTHILDALNPCLAWWRQDGSGTRTPGGILHTGKKKDTNDERMRFRCELQAKRGLLKAVLRVEDYEEAARLRDEIRALEAGLPGMAGENEA